MSACYNRTSPGNQMQRAGTLIGKLKLPRGASDVETRARAAWAVAVGKKIERHTRATMLVRNTLVVEVEDMVWQRQLNTMRPLLIHNLNEALGQALVSEIDFRSVPARMKPGSAAQARPGNEADAIADPVMRMLYKRSAKG
jgi:predicted nucleic acid-binding Zn ribbon protein